MYSFNSFGKRIKKALFATLILTSVLGTGCFSQAANEDLKTSKLPYFGDDGTHGAVQLLLTDFPLGDEEVTGVYVTFRKIEVQTTDGGWQTVLEFEGEGKTFDLLKLQNGVTADLGAFSLEPGKYQGFRFYLTDDNYIVLQESENPANERDKHNTGIKRNNKAEHNNHKKTENETEKERLIIPSGEQSGLKLISPFEITRQGVTTFTIDFDAQKSITKTGKGYILKPVLKINNVDTSIGSSGTVGTGGGRLAIPGKVNLDIPAGALSQNTVIEIVPVTAAPPSAFSTRQILSGTYEMLPDGTQFNSNITLIFNYDPAEVTALNLDENSLEVVYYDTVKKDWVSIGGAVDLAANTVTATVNHFTLFGVAGQPAGGAPAINYAEIILAQNVLLGKVTNVPQDIAATVTDQQGIATVDVFIKRTNDTAFTQINVVTGGTVSPVNVLHNLPLADFQNEMPDRPANKFPSLEVYIKATDTLGKVSCAPVTGCDPVPVGYIYTYDSDIDLDNMNDRWELTYQLDPAVDDANLDLDGDGTSNLLEYQSNTIPNDPASYPAFTVGGQVTGLSAGEIVTLQLNGANDVTVTGDGINPQPYTFTATIGNNQPYSVTVLNEPPAKKCVPGANSNGNMGMGDILNVDVNCSMAYTIQFNIAGIPIWSYNTTVTLSLNGTENFVVARDGTYAFLQKLAAGDTYDVQVRSVSTVNVLCKGYNNIGTATGSKNLINNIVIDCNGYTGRPDPQYNLGKPVISYPGRGFAVDTSAMNGKIIVGGMNTMGSISVSKATIWVYNQDGTPDTQFNGTGMVVNMEPAYNEIHEVKAYVDVNGRNKYIIAGSSMSGFVQNAAIWVYDEWGRPDPGFGINGKVLFAQVSPDLGPGMFNDIEIDTQGRIYLTGLIYDYSVSQQSMMLVRYNSNGTLDTTFGNGGIAKYNHKSPTAGYTYVSGIALELATDLNRIFVSGPVFNGNDYDIIIASFHTNSGQMDMGFGIGGYRILGSSIDDTVYDMKYSQKAGKIYIVGQGGLVLPNGYGFIAAFNRVGGMAIAPTPIPQAASAFSLAVSTNGFGTNLYTAGLNNTGGIISCFYDAGPVLQLNPQFGQNRNGVRPTFSSTTPNLTIDRQGRLIHSGSYNYLGGYQQAMYIEKLVIQ